MKPRHGAHEALATMMEQIGESAGEQGASGVEVAAAFENLNKFTLYKELDPDQPGEMSFSRVARLTSHFGAPAAAEHLARLCGHILVRMPTAENAAALTRGLAEFTREVGEALVEISTAMADGKMTPAEAKRTIKQLVDVQVKVTELIETVRLLGEEGRR